MKPLNRFLAVLMMFVLLSVSTSALTLNENEDTFIADKGDILVGSFIVDREAEISTNFEWISFDEYVPQYETTSAKDIEGYRQIKYYISIPDDADVGIYRTTIQVVDGSEIKYFNVKISVQNWLFRPIFKILDNPTYIFLSLMFLVIILGIYLAFHIVKVVRK